MKVALDAMGGDFAPKAIIEGALIASQELKDTTIILVGKKDIIEQQLVALGAAANTFEIVHAEDVIDMSDHPTRAFSSKPHSSIAVGFGLLKAGAVDAFCSAGNTGAMLVGAMFSIKTIEGIQRPAIAGFVPKQDGSIGVMMDAGANADVKPETLVQFGEIGSLYAQHVLGIQRPKVGLMNLGHEESKGTLLTQAAYQGLKINNKINFIGNIEGGDIFNNKADVIVVDGFTGNVILKMAESIYNIMVERKLPIDDFFKHLNYEHTGGSPIVGVNGSVVIGHGVSSPRAVVKMIWQSAEIAKSKLHEKIKTSLENLSL
jgi:glycerol-3-phosphate acyltransferase PlsX